MKELVEQLTSKANLTAEQAEQAAKVVKDFLADRLPESIRGTVDSFLTGENIQNVADQAKGMLGGLFGGDKK